MSVLFCEIFCWIVSIVSRIMREIFVKVGLIVEAIKASFSCNSFVILIWLFCSVI